MRDDTDAARAKAHRACIQALQAALARADGAPVEHIETHISDLLITRQTVYKFKKPLQLPFADFSTPQRREHFCREELRLNRRLAPELYLGVVPVGGTTAAPVLGGEGRPIDHAVCMRRFPADALWSRRLAEGRLLPEHVDRLARRLAAFHATAPSASPGSGFGAPAAVLGRVQAVLAQLQGAGAEVHDLTGWVATQGAALAVAFEQRRAGQAIREGHGDLHLANLLVLDDGEVTAFDCLEFDPALRWIDVMDDIAFTTMDLKAHGRDDLAWRLLDAYLQQRGDHAGLEVLRFYEVGRALVRALVTRLTPASAGAAVDGVDYLACARRLAFEPTGALGLAIMCGVSGSGKSWLAGELLELAPAVRLRSDVERKRLFGLAPLQASRAAGIDLYTADATLQTFDRLRDLARQALRCGYGVIVDAAFLDRAQRGMFHRLADELRVPFAVIHCTADLACLRERVRRRAATGHDPSEATPEVLDRQLLLQELPAADEAAWTLAVDTTHLAHGAGVAEVLDRWRAHVARLQASRPAPGRSGATA
ncbi:AAA family ATPase [Piscinibacter gummiphilus]|uniref:AAA family ATPase n=1 Tax=Piscinibacter gummiphilus TaxID=946333 RepID=A0ABZ0D056_9BURK|nr:AAA family ATPase [Piscinibacter gummiphilus]WOB10627.1 AAA family ATPase [Piscinibacter gummiphilus]